MEHFRNLCTAVAVMAGLAPVQPAWAAGTPAGTLIQNTATVSFAIGSNVTTLQSTTNTVKVDQLIGVAVTPLFSTPVAVGSTTTVLAYQVTNTGNGNDSFDLTAAPNVSGNAFNTVLQSVVVDSNGNGLYDPGVDATIANGAVGPAMAPDASLRVFVIVAPPASAGDTQTSQVRLTANSVTGTGTPGTLFAGKGVGGVDAVVGLSGGIANALEALVANLAQVTLTKSAAIADPYGGANPISGSLVTYTIVAHTTGSGTANGLVITDAFPAGTTYRPGTVTLNGAPLTDAATVSPTGIAVSLGNVAGGSADKTVTFQVKIN